jgi:glycosyltransferase involved in cell wall biosynthesis
MIFSALGVGTLARRLTGIRLGRLRQYVPKALTVNQIESAGDSSNLPVISIVTPSFNQGKFIGQTINSVVTQNYPHLQYVIQDAESTDSTAGILSEYTGQNIDIVIEKDHGQADALNRGFSRLSGDVMGYLNSDDMLLPGTLDFVGRFFRDNPLSFMATGLWWMKLGKK